MIEALFNQPNYVGTKKLLDATMMRHEAIASNLANLERPNYKRIDLAPDFHSALKEAMTSKNPSEIQGLRPQLAVDAKAVSSKRDGNTVQLENELMNLSQNTMEHSLETQLISSSLLKLRLAITGR